MTGECERRFSLQDGSDYLLLSLNIGRMNPQRNLQVKLFPSIDVDMDINVRNNSYRLVGFVQHISYAQTGGLNAGHYVTCIIENGHRVTYNDSVKESNSQTHFVSHFGQLEQPYIIMYQKNATR